MVHVTVSKHVFQNHRAAIYLESDKRFPYTSLQEATDVDIQDILPHIKSHPVAGTFQDLHLSADRQMKNTINIREKWKSERK